MYGWGSDTSASWSGSGSTFKKTEDYYNAVDKGAYAVAPSLSMDSTQAYMASSKMIEATLTAEEKELLSKLKANQIVVVPGAYDFIEKIFASAGIPHKVAKGRTSLMADNILLINCHPHNIDGISYKNLDGINAIREFVSDGGFLLTTDWTLEDVVMQAFPGYVSRGRKSTGNDHVEVDLVAEGSPYTKGLGNGSLKFVWWLEGSSYPIVVHPGKEVDILMSSSQMKQKYDEPAIAVKFAYGKGRVLHVTSHFFLQQMKAAHPAQKTKTGEDFAQDFLGLSAAAAKTMKAEGIAFGAVESAYTSLRFIMNVVEEKLRKDALYESGATAMEAKTTFAPNPEAAKTKKLV